jgi:UDP-GlcNAc:undecaprenyl-phosphate GlcNAc-1-phosphate transferase
MAIRSSIKGPATAALAAPVAVWAIPILDSLAAIVRRKLTGRSLYATDRGHLHHCLLAKFGSGRRTLAWIVACCIVTSAGALATVRGNSDLYAILSIVAVASVLFTTRLFGHVEARLVANSLKTSGLALLNARHRAKSPTDSIRWQGSADWDMLMHSLVEFSEKFNLTRVWLDVHMPAAQEGYRGSWQRPTASRGDELWRVDMPLFCGARHVGRLSIEGEHGGISACQLIELLMGVIQPFEERLAAIAGKNGSAGAPAPVETVAATDEPPVAAST